MEFEIVDTPRRIKWKEIGNAALANAGKSVRIVADDPKLLQNKASACMRHIFGKGKFSVNCGDGCIYVTAKEPK